MSAPITPGRGPLLRKLQYRASFDASDGAALLALPHEVKKLVRTKYEAGFLYGRSEALTEMAHRAGEKKES
jgi:hypothetical protein